MDNDTSLSTRSPSAPAPYRVAVLGPGGVGGLLGALIARTGVDVVCVAGRATARAISAAGLSVRSSRFGDFTVPVRAVERLDEPVDLCLITVKATHLDAALDRLGHTALDGVLLPLLNGVEHVAQLRARYPATAVLAATIRIESTRVAPGEIVHKSPFATVQLPSGEGASGAGASGDGVQSQHVRDVAAVLQRAGLTVQIDGDENNVLWRKLCFLAPLALLTTHARSTAGVVREQHREDLIAVIEEITSVARAEGAISDPAGVLAGFDEIPADMQSSMRRDADAGRPLELDAIGGAVLRAAARHALPVPVTTRLVTELQDREHGHPSAGT